MAPHKAPRIKKQHNVFSSNRANDAGSASPTREAPPLRPPLVSQSSETYEAAQEDEREVLKAIFMEDYEESEPKKAWGKSTDREIRLKLKSFSNEAISVMMSAKLTATYPKSLPALTLEGTTKLRKRTQERLQQILRTKPAELVGEVMLHEIATEIQDALEDEVAVRETDGAFENLGAERAVQEAAAVELAKQQEEDLQKQRNEVKAEEERMLQQMVSDEMRRKDLMAKRKSNRASVITPTSYFQTANSANYVSFDRVISLQLDDAVVECSAVEGMLPFRKGPATEELLVKPIGIAANITLVLKRFQIGNKIASAASQMKKAIMEFEAEMEEVKRLRQSAVLSVFDFKIEHLPESGWEINILMEYANKGSIGEKIEDDGQIPVAKVRSWTIEILEALDFLHRNGIVHKRVFPHNILLFKSSDGNISVKLADAAFQESLHILRDLYRGEGAFTSSWSAFWVPAELGQDSKRTRKTDVWDLGVVFLQMLFGLNVPHKYNSPKDLSDALNCSQPLQEMMRKFFKPDPRKRPSAFDLIPCEFLRNDVSIYDRPPTPVRSRHSSSSLGHYQLRRESSAGAGPSYSRYAEDWVEQGRLGKGGYGEVVKARNKVDGRIYAIKKIKQKSASALTEVLSEVMLLSRLNHPCVVRYYTAWPEEDVGASSELSDEDSAFDSDESRSDSHFSPNGTHSVTYSRSTGLDFISSNGYKIEFGSDAGSDEDDGAVIFGSDSENDTGTASAGPRSPLVRRRTASGTFPTRPAKSILYIQMEFCEKQTLRDLIRRGLYDDPEEYWRIFRQILEGLAHIHGHDIIHRDLKPDNIFIDMAKVPKIGDFGLATSGQYQKPDSKMSSGYQDAGGDMTRSVGTALYVAPELSSTVAGNYNNKVDMYSMGIIFFEMCYPLGTAMERDKEIRILRERKHALPAEFNTPHKSLQGSIIMSLISHRPSERPSCAELLRTGKVPVQIEDEAVKEALKALSDRNSPHYAKMMTALFSQTPDTQAKDYTWDMGIIAQSIKANDVLLQNLIKDRLAMVFRSHGAVEVQRQLLLPWSDHYADNNAVKLFDPSGTLVQLPYDFTLPHARSIGRGAPFLEKTFTIGHVYRDTYTGGAPLTSGEADFDILSYDTHDLTLKEAQVLKVVDELIDEFPSLRSTQMCFHINHSSLLEIVLDFCRISVPQRSAVKAVLSKLNIGKNNWQSVRNDLRSSDIGISSTSLDDLARFDWRDAPEKAFSKLRRIFEGTKYHDRTHAIFTHLSSVVSYTKLWNVKRKVYLSALGSFNEKFYSGGILFQCLFDTKQRVVLAAGGRYDKLIEEYRPKGPGYNRTGTGYHAVGVNIGWDRLVSSMTRYLKKPEKATFLKKHVEEDTPEISWMPRRCDCLVASFDPGVLRSSGVKMVSELIAHGYTAELSVDAHNIEDVLRHYRDDRHSWVIIIKHNVAPDKPDLKVKSIAKKEDTDLRYADLLNYLRNELRDREAREGNAALRSTKATPAPEPSTQTSTRANVDVLISHHRSKKSNKWSIVEAAQSRSHDLLNSFQDAPIAAIETKDEVMNSIRETRLSDPDTWRQAIQKLPIVERKYLQELHDLLLGYRAKWREVKGEEGGKGSGVGDGKAFVYNFRTGGCLLYDLDS